MIARSKRGPMKISRYARRLSAWQLVLTGLAFAGCGDDSKEPATEGRAGVLNASASEIARFALSDAPNPDFVAARTRVEKRVSNERVQYARRYVLGAGRTPISSDPSFTQVRVDAATALGTNIDPAKASDPASANSALDALLAEVAKYNAAAQKCDDLPAPKNDACAYALIIIEVRRSEGTAVVPTPTVDAGTPDSAVADAGGPVPTTLFSCGPRDVTGAVMAKARIDASETWSGKVLVSGTIYVNAGTLTIMPGTEIFMDADSAIEVGYTGAVTLVADGTPTAPIKFCGKTEGKGYWDAITISTNVTSNSTLRNVLFSDGSGTDAALHLDKDITLDNVQVRNGEKDGVWATDFAPASRALSVEGVGGNAVVLDGDGAATHFPLGGTLANNAPNEAVVRFTSISNDTVFHDIGIPYVQENALYQREGDVTFEAGVDYRLKADTTLSFGYGTSVAVHANGTADKPVKFTAAQGASGPFSSLVVDTGTTSNSNFTYTTVSFGGAQQEPALDLKVAVLIDNVTLVDNNTGMQIAAAGVAAGSKNLSITRTKGRPLSVDAAAVFKLPQGGTFTPNDVAQIAVTGSRFSNGGTIADLGVPYYLQGQLYTDDSPITIAPGVDFVMGADATLSVAYYGKTTFIAKGTAALPITFVGETASPGFWAGIDVDGQATTSSAFDYVQISHAGGGGQASLRLDAKSPSTASSVPVTNSKISQSGGACISKPRADTTNYAPTNTLDCTPPIADI
jgi:hypothetical protein